MVTNGSGRRRERTKVVNSQTPNPNPNPNICKTRIDQVSYLKPLHIFRIIGTTSFMAMAPQWLATSSMSSSSSKGQAVLKVCGAWIYTSASSSSSSAGSFSSSWCGGVSSGFSLARARSFSSCFRSLPGGGGSSGSFLGGGSSHTSAAALASKALSRSLTSSGSGGLLFKRTFASSAHVSVPFAGSVSRSHAHAHSLMMKGNHNLLRGGSLGPDNYNCSQYIQRRFRSNHKFRDAKGSLFRHPKNQQSFRKPKRIKMTVPKSVRMRFKVTGTGKILRWQTGRSHRRSHKSKNALGRLKRCVPLSKKSKEYKVLVKIGYRSKYRGRYR